MNVICHCDDCEFYDNEKCKIAEDYDTIEISVDGNCEDYRLKGTVYHRKKE